MLFDSSKHCNLMLFSAMSELLLYANISKFHIEHTQNGATVQHIHSIQVIAIIFPKQQLAILQASKRLATTSQHNNKRHGHEVQVKHDKR